MLLAVYYTFDKLHYVLTHHNNYYLSHSCFKQGRNHIFKVGGQIPWFRVLPPFYRKKLDRFTQFGAAGYNITLYSSKSYVKTWGSVQILGGSDHATPVVVPMVQGSH